jgi:hypothetical protein
MHTHCALSDEEYWVIWNGSYGIVDTVTIEKAQVLNGVTIAWLEEPYNMVGPFNLTELKLNGCINFEACLIMSAQKWQEDQVQLRSESIRLKREAMARAYEQQARYNYQRQQFSHSNAQVSEKFLRAALNLPAAGELTPFEIKAAYRRLAQKTHPDQGGSHEEFVRVTQARDALLKRIM